MMSNTQFNIGKSYRFAYAAIYMFCFFSVVGCSTDPVSVRATEVTEINSVATSVSTTGASTPIATSTSFTEESASQSSQSTPNIELEEEVSGNITGQSDDFLLTIEEDGNYFFEQRLHTGSIHWKLIHAESGIELFTQSMQLHHTVNLSAGSYILRLTKVNSNYIGDYGFQVSQN